MADNVTITQGSGTSIATEDVSGVQHQKVKIEFGTDGVATMVSASDPLPVSATIDTTGLATDATDTNTATIAGAVSGTEMQVDVITMPPVTIDTTGLATTTTDTNTGTIAGDTTSIDSKIPALGQALAAASVPVVLPATQITTLTPPAAITGFATEAKQDTIIGHIDGMEGLLTTIDSDTGTIATEVAGLLTDTELRATPVPVSGTVAVTNAGITTIAGAVSGTEMQVDVLTMPTTTVTATDLDIRPLVNTDVVTAELSAVDNAVLDTIAAKDFATQTTLAAINTKLVSGTDIGDVTINNASGASAVNIQDGGNTITVDGTVAVTNSDITSIKTAVEIIDNAISGSEMQVDVVGALPAGTNTIGAVKSVPSDIDINGSNANHADKYYTNAGAVTDGIIWSPAAGKRWHVLNLTINVSAACTVTIEDDLAAGDNPRLKFEFAANSGITIPYDKEHPFSSGEDAADLLITTTAGNVYVQAVGYEV